MAAQCGTAHDKPEIIYVLDGKVMCLITKIFKILLSAHVFLSVWRYAMWVQIPLAARRGY